MEPSSVSGKHCHVCCPIRDRAGHNHFYEQSVILCKVDNLGEANVLLSGLKMALNLFAFPDRIEV